jgi:hypothetical protein
MNFGEESIVEARERHASLALGAKPPHSRNLLIDR